MHADEPDEAAKDQVGCLESSGSRQTVGTEDPPQKVRRVILIRSTGGSVSVEVQARSRQSILQCLHLVLPFWKEMAGKEYTRSLPIQGFDSWKTALERGRGGRHYKSEMHNEFCDKRSNIWAI